MNTDFNYDYVGAFLFASGGTTQVDPAEMVPGAEADLSGYADAPPPISGYREADVQGMACWNCAHFTAIDDLDGDGVIDGICNLFEAQADGSFTCDRFTAHADLLRQGPHTSWTEDMANQMKDSMGPSAMSCDYSDQSSLNEIFLSGSATEEDGLVWKEILRTGEWTHTPTNKGVIERKLQIVRDGESNPSDGIISLSEVHRNFEDQAVPYVTIPLSDDTNDHKNLARLNTGYVRKLKLVDRENGTAVLLAGMDFTEPDVKEKVLRGTIPDVSAGIPFGVTRRRDNKLFNTVLDHVCLTRKPFIDGLSPFGLAAADSDADDLPIDTWEEEIDTPAETPPEAENPPERMSMVEHSNAITAALQSQLRLASDYHVADIRFRTDDGGIVTIAHNISNSRWHVAYKLTGDAENPVRIATVNNWKLVEPESEEGDQAPAVAAAEMSPLKRAQELRELRLAQPTGNTGGVNMADTAAPSLEGIELSDEARNRVTAILAENAQLRERTREGEVNERISELEELGLKDRPGALKLYREIMLSDDGGPAVVLFADTDRETSLTSKEVLDRFIDALKADGGVQFSDQALESGNDNKPPIDASNEIKPLEERVEESKKALYGSGKRTGRQ